MDVQINKTKIVLIDEDITKQNTDAIVNAANLSLRGGGGVDGAIHRAGGPKILEECMKYDSCPTGQAVITTAGKMPSKHVIHTVGPIWHGGERKEPEYLQQCYQNSLKLAEKHKLKSISFPSISTGAYGYPISKASRIALKTTIEFLKGETTLNEVRFVLFGSSDLTIYEKSLSELLSEN